MILTLTPEQIDHATRIGKLRNVHSRRLGLYYHPARDRDNEHEDILGAIGEKAVSVLLKLDWHDFAYDYRTIKADVGESIQVRTTAHPNGGLLIQKNDPADQVYILVRAHRLPEVEIVGWATGGECKKVEFWRGDWVRPCYLYPAARLNPMSYKVLQTSKSGERIFRSI